jgi:hypothetical protein
MDEISRGEIRLPEIQRPFVWKGTQVAKFIESLYRGYPSGSLLFWRTTETPETRAVAATAPTMAPAHPPLYLLDGQQRLTSLHRLFTDHPGAQIVFNVETEKFQNQSAATGRDRRWIKVHDVIHPESSMWRLVGALVEAGLSQPESTIEQRLGRIQRIADYRYHLEILHGLPYEEVAQIFVRVNSGRPLKTLDLAMATLSARWPGVLAKLEAEAGHWASQGYGDLDVNFLSRALAGAVLGRGLSAWSHSRLVSATDAQLEQGWSVVQKGLRHLVPMLRNNLGLARSEPIPSVVSLIPPLVMLGGRPDEPLPPGTADGIIYWLLVAAISGRYSGSTDTVLGQDIPAAREADPVRALLGNVGTAQGRMIVTPEALRGRGRESPYFFLSLLAAQANGARDWWYGTVISPGLQEGQRLEYHHIHPVDTLNDTYSRAEINDLANLAFISGKANRKISNKSPVVYFPLLSEDELAAHFVPLDEELREPDAYPQFLVRRRELLAEAMTALLDRFRPDWLDSATTVPAAVTDGMELTLTLYESGWDTGLLVMNASGKGVSWQAAVNMMELETAIAACESGIDGDIDVAGESVPVRFAEDAIEVPLGPFLVTGTFADWQQALSRERASAEPLSKCPSTDGGPWTGDRISFPITSTE